MPLTTFVFVLFTIVGASHLMHPQMWTRFFKSLVDTGLAPVIIAFMHLPLGLWIVLVHNDWSWRPGLVFTIIGWGYVTKGALYLLFPSLPERLIARQENFARNLRVATLMLFIIMIPMAMDIWQSWRVG